MVANSVRCNELQGSIIGSGFWTAVRPMYGTNDWHRQSCVTTAVTFYLKWRIPYW